jgi:cell division septal protein FtsQ
MLLKKSLKQYSVIKIFFFLILSVVFLIILYLIFIYFRITKITVLLNNKNYDLYGTELLIGKNILFNSENRIKELLFERNPQIENIKIKKKYPNNLIINFTLNKGLAEIQANNGYFVLTKKGKIINKYDKQNNNFLPKINYYQKIDYYSNNIGDYLDNKDLIYALTFTSKIKESGLKVDSIDIVSPNMIRLLLDGSIVYVTTEKNIEIQNNQLVKIIEQFSIEGKKFSSLDLRFDKPILKLK